LSLRPLGDRSEALGVPLDRHKVKRSSTTGRPLAGSADQIWPTGAFRTPPSAVPNAQRVEPRSNRLANRALGADSGSHF